MDENAITERPMNDTIAAFYDDFSHRLLRDYVKGNLRVSRAIETVETQIDDGVSRILDVGCGIGTSSFRFKSRRNAVTVQGVDISTRNVEIARQLFGQPGLHFSVSDMSEVPPGGPYDLIAMIDVYEHIPLDRHHEFHRVLRESLTPEGRIVLTTPTHLHQEYLAANHPEGLQVVDETLRLEDFVALAEDVGGTITKFEMVSVWHSYDYAHVVIRRSLKFTPVPRRRFLLGRFNRKWWWSSSSDGHPLLRRLRVQRWLPHVAKKRNRRPS